MEHNEASVDSEWGAAGIDVQNIKVAYLGELKSVAIERCHSSCNTRCYWTCKENATKRKELCRFFDGQIELVHTERTGPA